MNPLIPRRQRAERFAQLLDEANGGRRHHVRTRVDDELTELVALGRQLGRVSPPATDPGFRSGLRASLIATAEQDGIGTERPSAEHSAIPVPTGDRAPRRLAEAVVRPRRGGRGVRARGVIFAGVAASAIAVSGMSAASEHAVPGDALYTMKRSTERAQLALASSDLSRGQLFLDFARIRLAEAKAVRGDSASFHAVLNDMDADTRQGVRLLTTSAVARRDSAALDAVEAFLAVQRRQVAELLAQTARPDHERTVKSLALLDSVRHRADELRLVLDCAGDPAPRTDLLGPVPGAGCLPAKEHGTADGEGYSGGPQPSGSVPALVPELPHVPPADSGLGIRPEEIVGDVTATPVTD